MLSTKEISFDVNGFQISRDDDCFIFEVNPYVWLSNTAFGFGLRVTKKKSTEMSKGNKTKVNIIEKDLSKFVYGEHRDIFAAYRMIMIIAQSPNKHQQIFLGSNVKVPASSIRSLLQDDKFIDKLFRASSHLFCDMTARKKVLKTLEIREDVIVRILNSQVPPPIIDFVYKEYSDQKILSAELRSVAYPGLRFKGIKNVN